MLSRSLATVVAAAVTTLATIGGTPAVGRAAADPAPAVSVSNGRIVEAPSRAGCNHGPLFKLTDENVETGDDQYVSGYLKPAGRLVQVQQIIDGKWVTVAKTRTPQQCWYAKSILASCQAGTYYYRMVAPPVRRSGHLYPAVTSKRQTLRVVAPPIRTVRGLLRITNTEADGLVVTGMSTDGRFVSYSDAADPLCKDLRGPKVRAGTFIYDRETRQTTHITTALGGAISADGTVVVIITNKPLTSDDQDRDDDDLYLIDRVTGKPRRVAAISGCDFEPYYPVNISADGSRVLYNCTYESGGVARLVDTDTGTTRSLFRTGERAMTPDGATFVYVDDFRRSEGGGYLTVLDISDPENEVTERLSDERVDADYLQISDDGNYVLYLTDGRYIHIFDRSVGDYAKIYAAQPSIYNENTIGLSGDGHVVWYAGQSALELRNWQTGERWRLPTPYGSQRAESIVASADASELAFVSGMELPNLDRNVYLWSPRS